MRLLIGLPINDGMLIRPRTNPTTRRLSLIGTRSHRSNSASRVNCRNSVADQTSRNGIVGGEEPLDADVGLGERFIVFADWTRDWQATIARSRNWRHWIFRSTRRVSSSDSGRISGGAHVAVRHAQLQLARNLAILHEQEQQILHDLTSVVADCDRALRANANQHEPLSRRKRRVGSVGSESESGIAGQFGAIARCSTTAQRSAEQVLLVVGGVHDCHKECAVRERNIAADGELDDRRRTDLRPSLEEPVLLDSETVETETLDPAQIPALASSFGNDIFHRNISRSGYIAAQRNSESPSRKTNHQSACHAGKVGAALSQLTFTCFFREPRGQTAMSEWLVVERERAPSSEPIEFRGLADARPPATPRKQFPNGQQDSGGTVH